MEILLIVLAIVWAVAGMASWIFYLVRLSDGFDGRGYHIDGWDWFFMLISLPIYVSLGPIAYPLVIIGLPKWEGK
jgi:hypothetical protein